MDPSTNIEFYNKEPERKSRRNEVDRSTGESSDVHEGEIPAPARSIRSGGNIIPQGGNEHNQQWPPKEINDELAFFGAVSAENYGPAKPVQYSSDYNRQNEGQLNSHFHSNSRSHPDKQSSIHDTYDEQSHHVSRASPFENTSPPTSTRMQSPPGTQRKELLPPAAISSNTNDQQSSSSTPVRSRSQRNKHVNTVQHSSNHQQPQSQASQQQFHRKSIGDWTFIKTIGAGSMGKVKLAQHNTSGEICAVKIVPRAAKLYQRAHANDLPPVNAQQAAQRQKEFEKEVARDKRTIREGALGRLLFHPFICRLYEIVPMTNHYYMLFEYVEGGQMLDYIVSHGSLKERNARKFARGIASALDYCHRNNVVHRDLKIENIMINQKGDIKIIDFGLSNLYSPRTLLKTYCGSLYFAAPELLSAKPYTGPEVDVWSFGVVLYVLVCGKVPFDDQSVSVLHEKIKRGNVEYPSFISRECASLLSRMLVIDPLKRATLYEVMNHPWMKRGYDYPMSSFVPKRAPLTLPLDTDIIKAITSFELGSYQTISEELEHIVGSVEYQMSAENWYKVTEHGHDYQSASNANILPDPVGGFHPLISIYYLVDEMKKRKKAKEESIRAQLEHESTMRELERQKERAKIIVPNQENTSPRPLVVEEQPHAQGQLPKVPTPIAFPPQAHTSTSPSTYVKKSQSPPNLGGHHQVIPDQTIPEQQPSSRRESTPVESLDPNAVKGAGINSILRRLSSKKYKSNQNSPTGRDDNSPRDSYSNEAPPPLPKVSVIPDSQENLGNQGPNKKDPLVRRGVSMKVTAKEKSSVSRVNLSESQSQSPEKQEPPQRVSHERATSIPNKSHTRYNAAEHLPPLPNISTQISEAPGKQFQNTQRMHPTARAKSVGGHVRKDSYGYRNRGQTSAYPPLPNALASQNSDDVLGAREDPNDGFFDDVTLDDVDYQDIPQLTEGEIIEQFNNAKANSMPSIEYPKTLFLKGFFSVQTTSTKPLPVIRYNIINVLSKLGVRFQEVKGGFVCAHVASVHAVKPPTDAHQESSAQGHEENGNPEENKLYGNAFRSSSSLEKYGKDQLERVKTPDLEIGAQARTPSRQPSMHLNTQNLPVSPSSNSSGRSHRSSNSMSGGHRRKFSIGNSLLGSYRKKNGSQVAMPPHTPATAKVKSLYPEEDETVYGEEEHIKSFDDDSIDSLNGMVIGGSDMLGSSKLEQRARHQHTPSGQLSKRSPLKFEIHIVKVPLVGLYGVQFKKIFGNTWNYKTLAGQILNDLNL